MADELTGRGLGWVESPADERDWPIDALYAAAGVPVPDALPASYHVPAPLYPVLDQGSTPMCVAYSAAGEQGWFDLRDSGLALFDEAMFFRWIHGTANGAVIRDALDMRLSTGYPPQHAASDAGRHRIAAYYSVPVTRADICAAIASFGPVVIGTPWYKRWFAPVSGVLGTPDVVVGGHAILAVGWDATGLRLRNSWGADWGDGGEATLPWAQLHYLREAWKAVDQKTAPVRWRWNVRHGARVRTYTVIGGHIAIAQPDYTWTGKDSSAPCTAPARMTTLSGSAATVVRILAGPRRDDVVRVQRPGTYATSSEAPA